MDILFRHRDPSSYLTQKHICVFIFYMKNLGYNKDIIHCILLGILKSECLVDFYLLEDLIIHKKDINLFKWALTKVESLREYRYEYDEYNEKNKCDYDCICYEASKYGNIDIFNLLMTEKICIPSSYSLINWAMIGNIDILKWFKFINNKLFFDNLYEVCTHLIKNNRLGKYLRFHFVS